MKLKNILFLVPALTTISCKKPNNNVLTIIAPTGAPAITLFTQANNKNFETTSKPDLLKSYMASGSYDVIVAPTNIGISSINNGANYLIAATVSFGNFYIMSTGKDNDGTMNKGDNIVIFQQNSVPDKLFSYIYNDTFKDTTYYVSDLTSAATALENKKVIAESGDYVDAHYVLLAEPKVTATLAKNIEGISLYKDLQEEFQVKSNGLSIFQASIFIKASANKTKVDKLLNEISTSINEGLINPSLIKEGMEKYSHDADAISSFFGMSSTMAYNLTYKNNALGLGYKNAKENKVGIDNFLSCFNIKESNEKIYYQ